MAVRKYQRITYGPLHRVDFCAYCGVAFDGDEFELDHFPVPYRCGGTEVIAACIECHTYKDRLSFDKWSPLVAYFGIVELTGCKTDEDLQRIIPIFFEPFCPAAIIDHVGNIEERWPDLSLAGRILWARMRARCEEELNS